jgi:hypothetical protein
MNLSALLPILQEKENIMNTIGYSEIFWTKWNACKAKIFGLTRKNASRERNERENIFCNIQDLNMPVIENSFHTGQMKNERRAEWTPQGENIDHGFVDMRAKYVQRTQLFWTGLYGKEPWPRERKVWEKV